MQSITRGRPNADEYMSYFAGYIGRVPDGDILTILQTQLDTTGTSSRCSGTSTDGEQVFAYRALRIARGDATPLAGFEQDDYVRTAHSSDRTLDDLLEAYAAQRRATIAMLRGLDADAWLRRGKVSGHPSSARAWAYIAAGHELHHIADFHARYGI